VSSLLTEGTGIIVGVGVGAAASAALEPAIEIPRQDAWQQNPNRILDVGLLARLVAQGGIDLPSAHAEAARDGYQPDKVDALVYLEQTVPGIGLATDLWRKGLLDPTLYQHVLDKSGLDTRYMAPIVANKTAELIGLGDIAYAVVRGILPSPPYVPVPPPASGNKVPRYPEVPIDPVQLAAEIGYSPEMLQIMVGRSGLSLAPGLAANAFFRGLIGPEDFLLAIAEGDLRTEWAQTLQDVSRQIPTVGEMMEHALRGYETVTSAQTNAQRHGMALPDSQLVYDNQGRAPAPHAVTTGLARGGKYDGKPKTIPSPYLESVQRGNIRPEWYDIEYANRYTYPSAFVLRSLAQAGDLGNTAAVEQVLLEIGWNPTFAQQVAASWTGGAVGSDPHVSKAATQLWTTTHASYKAEESTVAEVTPALNMLGIPAAAQTQILQYWDAERALIRKQLSPTQIKKAYSEGVLNPSTGAPWSQQDAMAALLARGYDQAEAQTLLEL
jgi:hypothetical protein